MCRTYSIAPYMQDILDVSSASQESVDAGSLRDSFTEALGLLVMNRLDIQLHSRKVIPLIFVEYLAIVVVCYSFVHFIITTTTDSH